MKRERERSNRWNEHLSGKRANRQRRFLLVCSRASSETSLIFDQILIVILFSTDATPGADHAARSASSLSNHERTFPFKITLFPSVSTVIRFASVSTERSNACSIFCFSSVGVARGLTTIKLVTPLTPDRRLTTRSASSFWYCHST